MEKEPINLDTIISLLKHNISTLNIQTEEPTNKVFESKLPRDIKKTNCREAEYKFLQSILGSLNNLKQEVARFYDRHQKNKELSFATFTHYFTSFFSKVDYTDNDVLIAEVLRKVFIKIEKHAMLFKIEILQLEDKKVCKDYVDNYQEIMTYLTLIITYAEKLGYSLDKKSICNIVEALDGVIFPFNQQNALAEIIEKDDGNVNLAHEGICGALVLKWARYASETGCLFYLIEDKKDSEINKNMYKRKEEKFDELYGTSGNAYTETWEKIFAEIETVLQLNRLYYVSLSVSTKLDDRTRHAIGLRIYEVINGIKYQLIVEIFDPNYGIIFLKANDYQKFLKLLILLYGYTKLTIYDMKMTPQCPGYKNIPIEMGSLNSRNDKLVERQILIAEILYTIELVGERNELKKLLQNVRDNTLTEYENIHKDLIDLKKLFYNALMRHIKMAEPLFFYLRGLLQKFDSENDEKKSDLYKTIRVFLAVVPNKPISYSNLKKQAMSLLVDIKDLKLNDLFKQTDESDISQQLKSFQDMIGDLFDINLEIVR